MEVTVSFTLQCGGLGCSHMLVISVVTMVLKTAVLAQKPSDPKLPKLPKLPHCLATIPALLNCRVDTIRCGC